MDGNLAALLDRTARLMSKGDDERTNTLKELDKTLDTRNLQTNKTRSQTVLDNKAVVDVLLDLSATTRVAESAFEVLLRLAWNDDNQRRLVQEHPRLVPVAMRKLELGAENATEGVQIWALLLLRHLARNGDTAYEMVTTNPTLVCLLAANVEFKSEQAQVRALDVLQDLAFKNNTIREMVTRNPTLVSLLLAKADSISEQVQGKALNMLWCLTCNVDNAREMALKNPALVPLLVAKVKSNSEQVQMEALGVLQTLAANDSAREMVTKNPTLIPLLVAKLDSKLARVQAKALDVLHNLAINRNNAREMVTENPRFVPVLTAKMGSNLEQVQVVALGVLNNLVCNGDNARELGTTFLPLLVTKADSKSEQVQVEALDVLSNLAAKADNKREMVAKDSTLVPLLMAKVESNLKQVQVGALGVLQNLTINVDNAREMVAKNPTLVSLLVQKMDGDTALHATNVVYNLSRSAANRAILRGNNSVVAALTKEREDGNENTSFFSLVNLFGAEEDSKVLKTDLAMLQRSFGMMADAMNEEGGWEFNKLLFAFRCLCVVERNRQLLWDEYGSEFLISVLAALQRVIKDKNACMAESAVSTLAQFSSDTEPLAWMRSNKPRLDEVFAQLTPFPEALRTAQFLQLTLDPPEIAAPAQVAGSKPTIMISYEWTHKALAYVIHLLLESQGYPVWRDEQHTKADVADAVSKSTVVLVLVSPFYKESANCQMGCRFAHRNNRKLVPVLVEPGYKADGWLGQLFGGKLRYDVSGLRTKAQIEPVILSLLRGEVEGGKQPVPQNEAETRQWLSKHEHGQEIADRLVKEDLVEDLKAMFDLSPSELVTVISFDAEQAHSLHAALKELL